MRTALFLFICLTAIGCSSKFIPGNYTPYVSDGILFAGEEFTFGEDSAFSHVSFTDVSDDGAFSTVGIGKYAIKRNTITLYYEEPNKILPKLEEETIPCKFEDSLTYELSFIDLESQNKDIPYTALLKNDDDDTLTAAFYFGQPIKMIVHKDSAPTKIESSSIGWHTITYQIEKDDCIKMLVYTSEMKNYIESGTVTELEYKMHGNKLKLKRNNRDWRVFKKER